MRKGLFAAAMLCLAPITMQAEQVVVETKNTTLVLDVEKGQQPKYVYYGQKLNAQELQHLQKPAVFGRMEAYPAHGLNTPAEAALAMTHSDGNMSTALVAEYFEQGEVVDEGNFVTCITLKDPAYPITVTLNYKAYVQEDMIEAWTEITNNEKQAVTLTAFASAMLPIRRGNVWMSHFYGSWANETRLCEEPLTPGQKVIVNRDGTRNSHTDHGEVMFSLDGKGQENKGDVIGAAICYSGNYRLKVITDDTDYHYFFAGIDETNSAYHLKKGETFKTPALALTYSAAGLSGVSRNFHKWGRKYKLMHGNKERKILLNSWEGVYFDINQQGMDQMMKDIASMGGELFVMDDGWFGEKYQRNDDKSTLGDWMVDRQKLPGGIKPLVDKAKSLGIHFGIWIEPESANTISEFYEKHPDWVLQEKDRNLKQGRGGTQVLLDMCNPKVQDFVFKIVDNLMTENPDIAYIKWDANCSLQNYGSNYLPAQKQSHIYIEYHRGLLKTLERIRAKYPKLVIQDCSSGGGRVNYGLLPYFEEFWTSDNNDPFQRVFIQWGTSYFFPSNAMAQHIAHSPYWNTGRTSPIKYRTDVAMSGRLGIELQPANMTPEEREQTKRAVSDYKKIRDVVQLGNLYRLVSPYDENLSSFLYTNDAKDRVVLFAHRVKYLYNMVIPRVRLAGLDASKNYRIREINVKVNDKPCYLDGKVVSGKLLMEAGLNIPLEKDYASRVFELTAE